MAWGTLQGHTPAQRDREEPHPMGTKHRRAARKEKQPWELMILRTTKGGTLHVNCARCGRRQTARYWHPGIRAGVCVDCLPNGVHPPKLAPEHPDRRPMALT